MPDNIFTERLVLGQKQNNIIIDEHLIRYEFAKQFAAGKKVIDIACGSGYGAKILADGGAREVIGIDTDGTAIEMAIKNYSQAKVAYQQGNAESFQIDGEAADLIVSFETIEHLANQDDFLKNLKRNLKQDGYLIISTPNRDISKNKNPFHVKELNQEEFIAILQKYFQQVCLLKQVNGMATAIMAPNKQSGEGKIFFTNQGQPEYFIAFCSDRELPSGLNNIIAASINPAALANLRNNPILRLSDKIYPYFKKYSKIF